MVEIYKSNEISKISKILQNDGVVAVPTDTVYGLCARMTSEIAGNKLASCKQRDLNKYFPIMCANIEQIRKVAIVDEKVEKIIKEFMPGPITLVLKRNKEVPKSKYIEPSSIAVRMATSKELKELIVNVGCPVFMTSANKSGEDVCKTAKEIKEKLPEIDAILEGTPSFGKASTIVNCVDLDNIFIQREGPITREEIEEVIK